MMTSLINMLVLAGMMLRLWTTYLPLCSSYCCWRILCCWWLPENTGVAAAGELFVRGEGTIAVLLIKH
jgi:hypothetical protein